MLNKINDLNQDKCAHSLGAEISCLMLDVNKANLNAGNHNHCIPLILKRFIDADYQYTHDLMLQTTLQNIEKRKAALPYADEIWAVEHKDVYTLGQAGKIEHILKHTDTPIIHTDRGGQVTWHGTGQLVLYFLFDLLRLGFRVRDLVSHTEQMVIHCINDLCFAPYFAKADKEAPGVYVHQKQNGRLVGKIASIGFKIKHGFCYHGVAINIANDLHAFDAINPCGYSGLSMSRFCDISDCAPAIFMQKMLDDMAKRHKGFIALSGNNAV